MFQFLKTVIFVVAIESLLKNRRQYYIECCMYETYEDIQYSVQIVKENPFGKIVH